MAPMQTLRPAVQDPKAFEPSSIPRSLTDRWIAMRAGVDYAKWLAFPTALRAAIRRDGVLPFQRLHATYGGRHFDVGAAYLKPVSPWLLEFGVEPFITIAQSGES
jgi:hypothetical protein